VKALDCQRQCEDPTQNEGAFNRIVYARQYHLERRIVDKGAAKDYGSFRISLWGKRGDVGPLHV
jgi:hypothetical protein